MLLSALLSVYGEAMDEATGYEAWLDASHAAAARRLAKEAQAGVPLTGDVLADLLNNLAAIAERSAA